MNQIWYIYSNDIVSGPFSTENIESGLMQDKWSMQSLIWWKGQREWVSIEAWRKNLKTILDGLRTNIQTTAWYLEYLGTQKGPMNSKELYQFVQSNGIIGSCRVWANGMERWMNIFEIRDLVEYFGITRRRHSRAPIKGQLTIDNLESDNSLIGNVESISAGGLGVTGLEQINVGAEISFHIKSPLLAQNINTSAQIVYSYIGGYTGLEFRNLTKEYEDIISSYVNQFKF